MIEITFEDEYDAKYLYKRLLQVCKSADKGIKVLLDKGKVSIAISKLVYIEEILIPEIVQFIIRLKETQWIRAILKNSYFYNDPEEQNEILHIVYSIINGERKDIPRKGLDHSREQLIVESLQGMMRTPFSFTFDSYVLFRLRSYMIYLNKLIELSIDEYKLEQEYQTFIETLRQQVSKQQSRLACLHVVFRDSIFFYDETGSRITQEKLSQYIDERDLKYEDLCIDSNIIYPLLSIAPKVIHIYTAHADDNMIITIRNVFQERVKLYSICEFDKIKENFSF